MRRDREPSYNGADFRASRSAAIAGGQRPQWLQEMLSLEQTQVSRGGREFSIIDATEFYRSIGRIKKRLNGQSGRAFSLVHKATERRLPTGVIPGFMQKVIEHPSPAVPPIVVVQDNDPNPNARVRAALLFVDGKCVVRGISGVDRGDERTMSDVFRAEGYIIDTRGLNPTSGRE